MSERVALVTGAGAGVGRAVALRLARDRTVGTVLVNDVNGEAAEKVAGEVSELGARGSPRQPTSHPGMPLSTWLTGMAPSMYW